MNNQLITTVLIVEDDPGMQTMLMDILRPNYETSVRSNGVEALEYLQSHGNVDLILTDLNMPVMNGFELICHLQLHPSYSIIPVLIVSGEQNSETRIEALNAGADGFMMKPFNPAELLGRLAVLHKKPEDIFLPQVAIPVPAVKAPRLRQNMIIYFNRVKTVFLPGPRPAITT